MSRRGRAPRLEVYQCLDVQIAELRQRLGGLPNPQEAADIWRGIWFEEAHHSTAIEGNILVLKQVEGFWSRGVRSATRSLSGLVRRVGGDVAGTPTRSASGTGRERAIHECRRWLDHTAAR